MSDDNLATDVDSAQASERTIVRFSRVLEVPAGPTSKASIEERLMFVSWALGRADVSTANCPGSGSACFNEHFAAGVAHINFFDGTVEAPDESLETAAPSDLSAEMVTADAGHVLFCGASAYVALLLVCCFCTNL